MAQAIEERPVSTISRDAFVPPELWGKDHWSMIAYIDTIIPDYKGFQIGLDPRMRQNRRNFRVMYQECRKPRGRRSFPVSMVPIMEDRYGTRLANGTYIPGHDDWDCVQDLASQGLFRNRRGVIGADGIQPNRTIFFSKLGSEVMAQLREHKTNGGGFGTFVWNRTIVAVAEAKIAAEKAARRAS